MWRALRGPSHTLVASGFPDPVNGTLRDTHTWKAGSAGSLPGMSHVSAPTWESRLLGKGLGLGVCVSMYVCVCVCVCALTITQGLFHILCFLLPGLLGPLTAAWGGGGEPVWPLLQQPVPNSPFPPSCFFNDEERH